MIGTAKKLESFKNVMIEKDSWGVIVYIYLTALKIYWELKDQSAPVNM